MHEVAVLIKRGLQDLFQLAGMISLVMAILKLIGPAGRGFSPSLGAASVYRGDDIDLHSKGFPCNKVTPDQFLALINSW